MSFTLNKPTAKSYLGFAFNVTFCRIYEILLIKITTTQNEVALRYYRLRGLYFLAVIFAATIDMLVQIVLVILTKSITKYSEVKNIISFSCSQFLLSCFSWHDFFAIKKEADIEPNSKKLNARFSSPVVLFTGLPSDKNQKLSQVYFSEHLLPTFLYLFIFYLSFSLFLSCSLPIMFLSRSLSLSLSLSLFLSL